MIIVNGKLFTFEEYQRACAVRREAFARREYADHPDGELEIDIGLGECGICSKKEGPFLRAHSTGGETVTLCEVCVSWASALFDIARGGPVPGSHADRYNGAAKA